MEAIKDKAGIAEERNTDYVTLYDINRAGGFTILI